VGPCDVADGYVIGPRSRSPRHPNHTIGGLQRDGADHVVTDVLGDLEREGL